MTTQSTLIKREADDVAAARRSNGLGRYADIPRLGGGGNADDRLRIRDLVDERDELLERVRQLQAALLGDDEWIPPKWRLTKREGRVLAALASRPGVRTTEHILDAIYGDSPNGPPLSDYKIVQVFVCKMRPKLRAHGLFIQTCWGRGYYLDDEGHYRVSLLKEKAKKGLAAEKNGAEP
jgi:hypothetical protein